MSEVQSGKGWDRLLEAKSFRFRWRHQAGRPARAGCCAVWVRSARAQGAAGPTLRGTRTAPCETAGLRVAHTHPDTNPASTCLSRLKNRHSFGGGGGGGGGAGDGHGLGAACTDHLPSGLRPCSARRQGRGAVAGGRLPTGSGLGVEREAETERAAARSPARPPPRVRRRPTVWVGESGATAMNLLEPRRQLRDLRVAEG